MRKRILVLAPIGMLAVTLLRSCSSGECSPLLLALGIACLAVASIALLIALRVGQL